MIAETNVLPVLMRVDSGTNMADYPLVRVYKSWCVLIDRTWARWKLQRVVNLARIMIIAKTSDVVMVGASSLLLHGMEYGILNPPVEVCRKSGNGKTRVLPPVRIPAAMRADSKEIVIPAVKLIARRYELLESELTAVCGIRCVCGEHAVIDAVARLNTKLGLAVVDSYLRDSAGVSRHDQENAEQREQQLKMQLAEVLEQRGKIRGRVKAAQVVCYASCLSENWAESWVRADFLAVGGDDALAQPRVSLGSTFAYPDVYSPRLKVSAEMHGAGKYALDKAGESVAHAKEDIRRYAMRLSGVEQVDISFNQLRQTRFVRELIFGGICRAGTVSLTRPVRLFV